MRMGNRQMMIDEVLKSWGTMMLGATLALLLVLVSAAGAAIPEPDVIFHGQVLAVDEGTGEMAVRTDGVVTLSVGEEQRILASYALGSDPNLPVGRYLFQLAMEQTDPRLAATAGVVNPGEIVTFFWGETLVGRTTVPAEGTALYIDLSTDYMLDADGDGIPDAFRQDLFGDGSGDANGNGVSDLEEFLAGLDPAACVWHATADETRVRTEVFHPLVLQSCLTGAEADGLHNRINLARGTYQGLYAYRAAWAEDFDLELIGGYAADFSERSHDPALALLDADLNGDGTGEGTVLVLDTATGQAAGNLRVENLSLRNGVAPAGESGGGIRATALNGSIEIHATQVSGCTAEQGGGIALSSDAGQIILTNNTLFANRASGVTGEGGGLRIETSGGSVILLNNTLAENSADPDSGLGGGLYLYMASDSARAELANNIIHGNGAALGADIHINGTAYSTTLSLDNNVFDVANGIFFSGTRPFVDPSNLSGDPAFIAAAAGDFRLRIDSPLLDAGASGHPLLPTADMEGETRPYGSGIDIGADEYDPRTTDSDQDGMLDQFELSYGLDPLDPGDALLDADADGLSNLEEAQAGRDPSVNRPPTADGFNIEVTEDLPFAGILTGLDLEGQELTFTVVTEGTLGRVQIVDPVSGAFTYVPHPDANGSDSFTFAVSDGSGGTVGIVQVTVAAVEDAPTLAVSAVADGAVVNHATLNVAGIVGDDSGLDGLTVNGVAIQIKADGSFSHALTLVEGQNTISVAVTDLAGNLSTDVRSVVLDGTAAALTIDSPADNVSVAKALLEVSGSIEAGTMVEVAVNGGQPLLAATLDGAFSASVTLQPGLNTVEMSAEDLSGNRATAKRTVTLDATKFSLAVTGPAQDASGYLETVLLTGVVADALGELKVSVDFAGQNYRPTVSGGAFAQRLTFPDYGTWPVIVTAVDEADTVVAVQRNLIYVLSERGDLNSDGLVDVSDALLAMRIAVGLSQQQDSHLTYGDVAPLVDGSPSPDGQITAADALVILRKAVGLVNW